MELKVLTLKFDPVKETFDDQPLNDFCLKNEVLSHESYFFNVGDNHYLSILVH